MTAACLVAGCPRPVTSRGRCHRHGASIDACRGLGSDRLHEKLYHSARWRRLRAFVLAETPLCQCDDCHQAGRVRAAGVVHHRQPHGGDPERFFDSANLQALAKTCHDRLTGRGVQISGATRPPTPLPGVARVAGSLSQGAVVAKGGARG
jgi:5-methylcytosine-specific restriction protein A